jgi:pimeloyl-ACP methyl ester carboxylesterase
MAPFRSEATVVRYARQLLDFWSFDVRPSAGRVRAPVLFVGAEHDSIASTAASRAMARLFPRARYAEVQGATHYCLYDRPALIAGLMEAFFRDPDGPCPAGGDVTWHPPS